MASIIPISIHAPAKGATLIRLPMQMWQRFQSTLPRRERLYAFNPHDGCYNISIHAPAKGATGFCSLQKDPKKFQSTLPRRERLGSAYIHGNIPKFQSTLPRRERQSVLNVLVKSENISIHAPAKGATRSVCFCAFHIAISIHAPAKGATQNAHRSRRDLFISIHAPAKGATM